MEIFAHRGFSARYPENTIMAMEAALNIDVQGMGISGIELDVQAVDGEAVVFHDRRLERCTNGAGWLSATSLTQLRRLDAGQGQQVPLLSEVFELVQNRCLLNIEIKHPSALEPTFHAVDQACLRWGVAQEQLIFSSFYHTVLLSTRDRYPASEHAALIASAPVSVEPLVNSVPIQAIHGSLDAFCRQVLQESKHHAQRFRVYTVDAEQDVQELRDVQVDGIFCNNPLTVLNYLTA